MVAITSPAGETKDMVMPRLRGVVKKHGRYGYRKSGVLR
jgi:hypothetical protein